ncbi:chitin deacetylase-like 5 isoform X2 [Rhynchophorus ferrugineus]|uniref:chitin deacetylase-like 5 isoform X2 n=1 Tax=Rhynchophorus ferrugineus TaxID=354439 RepID=UPI003FCD43DA
MIPKFIFATVLLSIFLDAEAQRKLSRPLPTLAETKGRERANFDCPEEFGYYPHPTDCTQYYVCVFGGALLESCTGGLMYSHELQTCDWPRNVGCDGLELPASAPSSSSSSGSQQVRSKERLREKDDSKSEQRIKYAPPAPPPPPQPRAVVTSRGQPRQLQTQQEIIKQPLYADVEDALPPAEEIESDRQQRVYRGQPSTIGQVQRDRDGYRHTNSLSSRGEKVEVISFGTQSQLQPYSDEKSSISPSISTTTATARAIYNNSQYNHVHNNDNRYDPYYALYDDDVELYKDVDYTPQNHYNTQQQTKSTTANVYRGSTVSAVRDETPKRGSIPYNSVSQDIYQPSTVSDYGESSYQDDENTYRQSSRGQNSLRGDRNEINDIEEIPTTKRITTTTRKLTTTTTRTTTTQARTLSTKKSITASPSLKPVNEKKSHVRSFRNNTSLERNVVNPVIPESHNRFPKQQLPSTDVIFNNTPHKTRLPNLIITKNNHISKSTQYNSYKNSSRQLDSDNVARGSLPSSSKVLFKLKSNKQFGTVLTEDQKQLLKNMRRTLNPITINQELVSDVDVTTKDSSTEVTTMITPLFISSTTMTKTKTYTDLPKKVESLNRTFSPMLVKPKPSSFYKLRPVMVPSKDLTRSSPAVTSSHPANSSRANSTVDSLVNGRTGLMNCNQKYPTKCKLELKLRTPSRGRGTSHYSNGSGSGSNNEATATVNRGTPATRSRPTLKPSTSIVSKAAEYVDIYRFPPIRPEPIYPQPQPDKTAAKCRKDVCLLPDCYCGGKDIPGNIPVDQTPQMVLMTFDDAVNDLNKEYYYELFENGRKNPNGCPISATFYVSHEWTDYSQVQNLYADGHEFASHTVSHSFGEQFSQKKWTREVAGQREILAAYGGVKMEDVRGMRAPFLSVGGNKMFKMLYDSNFTYDSSMPIYENKPPSWPYTLDYKLFHDCMIPPCPTRSYPGVWEVPMVMWQDLNGGRCSMGDACSNPPDADGVYKMLLKNFERHYTTNRAPFGLFYHAAWFTQPHHKEGFINFIDTVLAMKDVWFITNWQAIQWVRDPTPSSRLNSFQPFQCNYSDRPKRCNNPKVCNLWHKSGVRYMRTCQPCPDIYPWTGNTGIRSSRIDNDIED